MSWFKESEYWKEWTNDCHTFDKSIEDLWAREDLTDIEKEDLQNSWLESFNQKMNNKSKRRST